MPRNGIRARAAVAALACFLFTPPARVGDGVAPSQAFDAGLGLGLDLDLDLTIDIDSTVSVGARDPRGARREVCALVYLAAFEGAGDDDAGAKGDKGGKGGKGGKGDKGTRKTKGAKGGKGGKETKAGKGAKAETSKSDQAKSDKAKLAIVGTSSPSGAPSPAGTARTEPGDRLADEVLAETNKVRATFAMPPLRRSPTLALAARIQAADMARRSYRDHVSPEGCTAFDRVIDWLGYPSGGVAENLAEGREEARAVVADWMASPSHRANILHPDYSELGVAAVRDPQGTLRWAQVFGDAHPGNDEPGTAFLRAFTCPDGFAAIRIPGSSAFPPVMHASKQDADAGDSAGAPAPSGLVVKPAVGGSGRSESQTSSRLEGAPGSVCSSSVEVRGPFSAAMREACRKRSPAEVCDAASWPRALFFELRGSNPCPPGTRRDPETGVCFEGKSALGPFPDALRVACQIAHPNEKERAACALEVWDLPRFRRAWRFGGF